MNEMASNGHNTDSVKSFMTDKMDETAHATGINEKESSIISSVDKDNEQNNTVNVEEKNNLTLDTTNENLNTMKEDTYNVKNKNKHDLKAPVTDANEQDDSKANEKEIKEIKEIKEETEIQNIASTNLENTNEKKDSNIDDNKDSLKGYTLKRKRRTPNLDIKKNNSSNIPTMDSPMEEGNMRSKRKKLKSINDRFCWRCHKESVDICCTACPRSWHRKCIGVMPSSLQKWICGECATILRADNAETRSTAMAQLSIDQLCMLLKHVVERLRDYPGSEPFCKPVDLIEVPNYMDYVVKPMDLSLLESNVRAKLYGSTDTFMADAKWIQHNCIVFNTCGGVYTDTSKLTNAAKQIIKVARQEVSEIEACPDCYAHGRNLPRPQPSWFIEPCRRPHPLVWAKLKGFPFWPAKAMPRLNSQGFVDVRFFGEHDRAWVAPKDLYLYSEEPPAPSPRKRKSDMDECVHEVTRHCRKLELMFGQFKFAPPKVQYNPNDLMQITLMLPNYNPLQPNNHFSNSESSVSKKKILPRKRNLPVKLQDDEEIANNEEVANVDSKGNANGDNHEKESEDTLSKVQKLDSDDVTDVTNTVKLQNNLSGNYDKLNKKQNQDIIVAQSKTIKNGAKNMKTSNKDKNTENSNVSVPNASTLDKKNSQKAKDETKSVTENQISSVTSPIRESTDVVRTQKRKIRSTSGILKNIVSPKRDVVQNVENVGLKPKYSKSSSTVYKPKTRMVDKLNAEKAARSIPTSKENDKLLTLNTSKSPNRGISLLNNNTKELTSKKISEIDIILSPPATSTTKISNKNEPHTVSSANLPATHSTDKSVLLLVVNNGKTAGDAKQQVTTVPDHTGNKDTVTMQREMKQLRDYTKKESKAKKTFPNKPRYSSQVGQQCPIPTKTTESSVHVSSIKPETSSTYQLLPPEAGPISARLHHSVQELARRMGQMMEEAYKEAAEANGNGENGTTDNYQATIFFLRMQIEHMKWQHQQQLAEFKHNADRTMREMRASMEAEKLRSVEETRREIEEDKARCIEETKRKQWCAKCGQEALFYCCWNTAYCDYPCQQSHWPTHMRTCSQQPAFTSMVNTSSAANVNSQAQNGNIMTHTQESADKIYTVSCSKVNGISSP